MTWRDEKVVVLLFVAIVALGAAGAVVWVLVT